MASDVGQTLLMSSNNIQESVKVMAEKDGNVVSDNIKANGLDDQPAVGLISQYIKDLSVENPNSPESFNWEAQPQIDVQVNIQVERVSDEVHEVALKITTRADCDNGVMFNVELDYGALWGLRNIADDQAHPFLFGEAPRLMFPFARRIIADAIRETGFPPFVLEPIDFNMLYVQQRAQAEQMVSEQPAGEA